MGRRSRSTSRPASEFMISTFRPALCECSIQSCGRQSVNYHTARGKRRGATASTACASRRRGDARDAIAEVAPRDESCRGSPSSGCHDARTRCTPRPRSRGSTTRRSCRAREEPHAPCARGPATISRARATECSPLLPGEFIVPRRRDDERTPLPDACAAARHGVVELARDAQQQRRGPRPKFHPGTARRSMRRRGRAEELEGRELDDRVRARREHRPDLSPRGYRSSHANDSATSAAIRSRRARGSRL